MDYLKGRHFFWLLSYFLIVGTSLFVVFSQWAYDDPFISYRYAFNLLHGNGLVYNVGEKSLSMTSPFFVLLVATISLLWNDLPRVANFIGAFSIAAGGVFLWDLSISLKTPTVGWVSLFLFPTVPLLVSTIGSETPLYIALCLASFAFYVRQKHPLMAVTASLATLTRPDGIIVLVLLVVGYLYQVRRSISWNLILIIICIIFPWFLFSWHYYGSPIPLTLMAKQHQGSMAISQRFAPGLVTVIGGYTHHLYFQIEGFLAILGLLALVINNHQWILFIIWQILYFASYSILGVSRYFWYYAPLVPGFITLIGLGFASIFRFFLSFKEKGDQQTIPHNRFLSGIVIFLIAIFAFSQALVLHKLREEPDTRYPIYREAGEWIRANTPKDASIGALEVGIIGYYSERFMVDFSGLLQPDISSRLSPSTTYEDAAYWAVEHYNPNYLVILEGTLPILENNYASKECEVVHQIRGEIRGQEVKLYIYSCFHNDMSGAPAAKVNQETSI